MEDRSNTKDMIEKVALDLFSKKGYQSVSIRDISKQVGIKESSIYYHFKNKQDIMDFILEKINSLIDNMRDNFEQEFIKADSISDTAMCEVAVHFLKNYLLNPYVYQVLSFLMIEQMSDRKAYETYQRLVFELPLLQQEQVFREMIQRGFIKQNNPAILAQEYYAVIYFSFQKNCIGSQVTEDSISTACYEIKQNITDIYQKMKG